MTCWRCGRVEHSSWCSDGTANDCTHCGGNPCRWWCEGPDREIAEKRYCRTCGAQLSRTGRWQCRPCYLRRAA